MVMSTRTLLGGLLLIGGLPIATTTTTSPWLEHGPSEALHHQQQWENDGQLITQGRGTRRGNNLLGGKLIIKLSALDSELTSSIPSSEDKSQAPSGDNRHEDKGGQSNAKNLENHSGETSIPAAGPEKTANPFTPSDHGNGEGRNARESSAGSGVPTDAAALPSLSVPTQTAAAAEVTTKEDEATATLPPATALPMSTSISSLRPQMRQPTKRPPSSPFGSNPITTILPSATARFVVGGILIFVVCAILIGTGIHSWIQWSKIKRNEKDQEDYFTQLAKEREAALADATGTAGAPAIASDPASGGGWDLGSEQQQHRHSLPYVPVLAVPSSVYGHMRQPMHPPMSSVESAAPLLYPSSYHYHQPSSTIFAPAEQVREHHHPEEYHHHNYDHVAYKVVPLADEGITEEGMIHSISPQAPSAWSSPQPSLAHVITNNTTSSSGSDHIDLASLSKSSVPLTSTPNHRLLQHPHVCSLSPSDSESGNDGESSFFLASSSPIEKSS